MTVIAACGLLMLGTVSAHADHDDLLYPAADWQIRQIGLDETEWSDAEASTIVDATTVDLTKPSGDVGTSAENANLGVAGDVVSVDIELIDGATADTGAVRLFVYDHADADTLGVAPAEMAIATGAETLSLTVPFDGEIGTIGVVYDASNASAGTVRFTNLRVDDQPVSLLAHVEPEPEPCEFDDTLTADDEACVQPDDTDTDTDVDNTGSDNENDQDTSSSGSDSETDDPAEVPTAVPAGATLPNTGTSPLLLASGGAGLLLAGGIAVLLTRQRRAGRYQA